MSSGFSVNSAVPYAPTPSAATTVPVSTVTARGRNAPQHQALSPQSSLATAAQSTKDPLEGTRISFQGPSLTVQGPKVHAQGAGVAIQVTKPSFWKSIKACFAKIATKLKAFFVAIGKAIAAVFERICACFKKRNPTLDALNAIQKKAEKLRTIRNYTPESQQLYLEAKALIEGLPLNIASLQDKTALDNALFSINQRDPQNTRTDTRKAPKQTLLPIQNLQKIIDALIAKTKAKK